MENKTSQSGFTLIELIAVMVILGILAAVLIPRMTSVSESAYEVNAKQMYSALESHLYMQSQQLAITGAHGVESFPVPNSATGNFYLNDWIKDYDSEHWTQWRVATGGLILDDVHGTPAAQDAIYFLYHPHSGFTGTPTHDLTWADPDNGITVKKDVYYITYYPLTNSAGFNNGIRNNDFHLALHKDSGQDRVAQNNNSDDTAVDLYHCGGDDKDNDGGAFAAEVAAGAVCEMH